MKITSLAYSRPEDDPKKKNPNRIAPAPSPLGVAALGVGGGGSSSSSGGITIGTTTVASGTAGRVLYETDANIVGSAPIAVNALNSTYLTVTSAAAAGALTLSATGGGAAEDLRLSGKGTGAVHIPTLVIGNTASGGIPANQIRLYDSTPTLQIIFAPSSAGVFYSSSMVQHWSTGIAAGANDLSILRSGTNTLRLGNSSTGAGLLLIGTSTDTADAQLSVYSQSTTRPGLKLRALAGTAATQATFENYDASGTLNARLTAGGTFVAPILSIETGSNTLLNSSGYLGIRHLSGGNGFRFQSADGVTSFWQITNSGHLQAVTDNTYDIGASGATRPRNIYAAGSINADGGLRMAGLNGALITGTSTNIIRFIDQAGTGFDRLQFGGTTSSYPALKRSSAELQVRLADDSAFAAIQSLYIRYGSGTPEGAVTAPVGAIYSRTDGGAGTSFYVKESGTGNTGWVAK